MGLKLGVLVLVFDGIVEVCIKAAELLSSDVVHDVLVEETVELQDEDGVAVVNSATDMVVREVFDTVETVELVNEQGVSDGFFGKCTSAVGEMLFVSNRVVLESVLGSTCVWLADDSQLVEIFNPFSSVVACTETENSVDVDAISAVEVHGVDVGMLGVRVEVAVVEQGVFANEGVVVVVGQPHELLDSSTLGFEVVEVQPEVPTSAVL